MKSYPECEICTYKNMSKCDSCATYDQDRTSESCLDDSFLTSLVVTAIAESILSGFISDEDLLRSIIFDSLFGDD
jgi:hypothetical protein